MAYSKSYQEVLSLYDDLVANSSNFERKGKTIPYTSANGHMFSFINKEGELGFRFSKDDQEAFIQEHQSTLFKSHGAIMRGYVLIPEVMLDNKDRLMYYLQKSYEYVLSLDPK